MTDADYPPGYLAPATGVYRLLNVFGTATPTRAHAMEGQPLPDARLGYSWRLERLAQDTQPGWCRRVPSCLPPLLADPHGTAQRVAMAMFDLAPERRKVALRKIYAMHCVIAVARGHTEIEAAASALDMRGRIEGAMLAIEVSGGGADGRG
jgi:hypothetical protein